MNLVVPHLDLAPGKIICLHIPQGFEAADEALESELLHFARQQGKTVAISRQAELAPSSIDVALKQMSTEWLSNAAGISERESAQIITDLGVRVAETLADNAGTPRCLLGLAATLVTDPEVVAYSSAGLDVEGIRAVHRFVASRCSHRCVVHVSYPSVFGDGSPHPRECPQGGECIELTGNSGNAWHG